MADRLVSINTAEVPGEQLPLAVRTELLEVAGDLTGTVSTVVNAQAPGAVAAVAPAAVTADLVSRTPQVIADPDNPSTHIRFKLGDAVGPAAPASATWLSVDGDQVAAYDLDTTPLTAADVGAYTTAQIDALVAAVASLSGTETLTNKTLVTPKIQVIRGTNNNNAIVTVDVANAVSCLQVANAAGANAIQLAVNSTQTNVDMWIGGRGTGRVVFRSDLTGDVNVAVGGPDANAGLNIQTGGTGWLKLNSSKVVTEGATQTLSNKTFPLATTSFTGGTSVGAAATDAATTQTLVNNLRSALIAKGLVAA